MLFFLNWPFLSILWSPQKKKIFFSSGEAVDHCYSNPCNNGGTCESLMDSYECACPSGYTGVNCEMGRCTSVKCANLVYRFFTLTLKGLYLCIALIYSNSFMCNALESSHTPSIFVFF